MSCQFLVVEGCSGLCKGCLGGYKVPSAEELKAYCNGDFKACHTYQGKAEYDPESIKKEGKMDYSPENYLVLMEDNGNWRFEEVGPRDIMVDLLLRHKEAVLVRFAVVTTGGNYSFERKCEAVKEAASKKVPVSLMQPHRDLPGEAQEMYYSAL